MIVRTDFYSEISELQGCDFSARYEHSEKMTAFVYDAEKKAVKSLSFGEKCQHNSDNSDEPEADTE